MAISHPTPVRTDLASLILAKIDAGAGPGVLEIQNSGAAVLASVVLNKPAGVVANGTITFDVDPLPKDTSGDANGTAALFTVRDSAGLAVYSGTISGVGGGGNLEMISTQIVQGLPVELTAMSYSASP
jgi:hypothetical protein